MYYFVIYILVNSLFLKFFPVSVQSLFNYIVFNNCVHIIYLVMPVNEYLVPPPQVFTHYTAKNHKPLFILNFYVAIKK